MANVWVSWKLAAGIGFLAWWIGEIFPGSVGENHCRLRHVGWERSGHGVTSRPRGTSSVYFLGESSLLFQYPALSGVALVASILLLSHCAAGFAT